MNKLNNREIAELLKSTFADAAPDQKESIIKAAESHSPAVTVSVTQENTRGVYIKRAALIAASFLIVFGVIFTLILINANKVCSTVLVESDSCVEIALNRDRRPVSINAVDNAAAKLVQKIDKGASLSQAVDNILDTMQENGNLTEDDNTILITADDPEDASDLLKESFNAAKESFDDADFSGAILTTVASDDKKVNQLSHRHHISVGKAEMIRDIIRTDSSLSAALLSRLSVNDLNLLTSFRRIRYQDIDVFGTSRGCMDPSDIISYVCMEAGASNDNAVITLGVSQYGLVYSVTVYGESRVYIYRLDAENGEVLAVSQGKDLETAQMADRNTPTPAPSQKKASSATTKATRADKRIADNACRGSKRRQTRSARKKGCAGKAVNAEKAEAVLFDNRAAQRTGSVPRSCRADDRAFTDCRAATGVHHRADAVKARSRYLHRGHVSAL